MIDTELSEVWHRVGPADSIPLEEAVVLDLEPPIAVFHIDEGFFALDDTCTHAQASMAAGFVEDGTVECELHLAKFDIQTGAVLSPPATKPLRTYPVYVEEGVVYVDLRGRAGCPFKQAN